MTKPRMHLIGWERRGGHIPDETENMWYDVAERAVVYNETWQDLSEWAEDMAKVTPDEFYYERNMDCFEYAPHDGWRPRSYRPEPAEQAYMHLLWTQFVLGEIDLATWDEKRCEWESPPYVSLEDAPELSNDRLLVEANGSICVYASQDKALYRVSPTGSVTRGSEAEAEIVRETPRDYSPLVDGAGRAVDVDGYDHLIRRTEYGTTGILAGCEKGFQDGRGIFARFAYPSASAWLPDGSLCVFDHGNRALRTIDGDGRVTTLARLSLLNQAL